jgi:transcriptional regulator with XRE-family HTH domain
MQFADKLKELRASRGIAQPALAERAGIPLSTLRSLEQGRRLPNWSTLQRIALALEASLGDFDGCELAGEKPATKPAIKSKPKK